MTDPMTAPGHPAAEQALAHVRAISPYVPGKPAEAVAREYGVEDIVKLASNENPLGPSPAAQATLAGGAIPLNIYPDGSGYRLKQAISTAFGLDPAGITLGNGSNDCLEMVARAWLGPGRKALFSAYAFAVYALATQAAGATAIEVPALPPDHPDMPYGADLPAMLAAIDDQTRVVFLANPNNPTGTWVDRDALVRFLDGVPSDVVVVLDEAYTEYVDDPDFPDGMELLPRYPNLIVTRTFSKIHGLAALRVGYAVSDPSLAAVLDRVRQPFNANALALSAAEAALGDSDFISRSRAVNAAGLKLLVDAFTARGLSVIPSRANFVTVDVGHPAGKVFQALLREGVIVRPMGGATANYDDDGRVVGLGHHLRITVGTEAQNDRVIAALDRVLAALDGEARSRTQAQSQAQAQGE